MSTPYRVPRGVPPLPSPSPAAALIRIGATSSSSSSAAQSLPSGGFYPELDVNGLQHQLDYYADETVKAAKKVQTLPSSEMDILRAAAAYNKTTGSQSALISPERARSTTTGGSNSRASSLSPAGRSPSSSSSASASTISAMSGGATSWKSLPTLPPYILRMLFAAGQMCVWLLRSGTTANTAFAVKKRKQQEQQNKNNNSSEAPHQPVVGYFSHLVLSVHEQVQMDPEQVIEYLTEFSEFPQISELEVVLHETMSNLSGAQTSTPSKRNNNNNNKESMNNLPEVRSIIPCTEGELLSMSPTQRAQLASDILLVHRSPVTYAVRQWCFAIGKYLLLLDQWVQMQAREVRLLSKERMRSGGADYSSRNSSSSGSGNGGGGGVSALREDEEAEVEAQLARTRSDLENTFRDRFHQRGGMQLLLGSNIVLEQQQQLQEDQEKQKTQQEQNQEQKQERQRGASSSRSGSSSSSSSSGSSSGSNTARLVVDANAAAAAAAGSIINENNKNTNNETTKGGEQQQQQQQQRQKSSSQERKGDNDLLQQPPARPSSSQARNVQNASTSTPSSARASDQNQQQQQSRSQSVPISTMNMNVVSPQRNNNNNNTNQQQNLAYGSPSSTSIHLLDQQISSLRQSERGDNNNDNNNYQQQRRQDEQQQQFRPNLLSPKRSLEQEERQRAIALLEQLRHELANERQKRQSAEAHNTELRLEASKFETRLNDASVRERSNAERQVKTMQTQLDVAQIDAEDAIKSREVAERARDEMAASLRSSVRALEDQKAETQMKVQQLLQKENKLEDALIELRESREAAQRAESRAEQAELSSISSSAASPAVSVARHQNNNNTSVSMMNSSSVSHSASATGNAIRTSGAGMVFAPEQRTGGVLGVYQGTTPTQVALSELQNLEGNRRSAQIRVDELESRVAILDYARASLLHHFTFGNKKLGRVQAALRSTEDDLAQLKSDCEQQQREQSSSSTTEIQKLRKENASLQRSLQDTVFTMQSQTASKTHQDEARISTLEKELSEMSARSAGLEEQVTTIRLQAAENEQQLKSRYYDEQEARVKSENATRIETEKVTKLLNELEGIQKEKLSLAEQSRDAVAEAKRVSNSSDSSTKILYTRVSELERDCERHVRDLEDVRRQNRSLNDEMAAVRRHNATLDTQLSMHGATRLVNAENSSQNNVLVDALRTKIEALESKEREQNNNHQNTVSQLEQRLSKLRGELLSATESSEHTVFELRRTAQQQQLKAESLESQSKDWQRRCEETEKELDSARQQNRDISSKLQLNSTARSDNEALKEQLKFVEDDLAKKRDEVHLLRNARSELSARLQELQKEYETAKMDRDRQMHLSKQTLQECERSQRRVFDDALGEAELRQKARFDLELAKLVEQLQKLEHQDQISSKQKEGLENNLRESKHRLGQLEQQNKSMGETIGDMRDMVSLLKNQQEIIQTSSSPSRLDSSSASASVGGGKSSLVPTPPAAAQRNNNNNNNNNNSEKEKETLETIASRVGVSIQDLLAANPNIASSTTILPRGTRVMLPPVKNQEKQNSAATSTGDLSSQLPSNVSPSRGRSGTPPPTSSSSSSRQLPSHLLDVSPNTENAGDDDYDDDADFFSTAGAAGDHANWNSIDHLVRLLGLQGKLDEELLLQLNETLVQQTDVPLAPGANVVLPFRNNKTAILPSLVQMRQKLRLTQPGCVKLRSEPEPSNPSLALPIGSIVKVTRSLKNPYGTTLRDLSQRLSMNIGALLEANPAIKEETELIPFYRTVFVPRREDPADALSVSWRRSRRRTGSQSPSSSSAAGSGTSFPSMTSPPASPALGEDSNMNPSGVEKSTRPAWTLEETAKRCGVSFDELMMQNSAAFPGTCRLPQDLLPHFVPFKFVLRPFRANVHPARIQDVSRMLKVPVEELMKANSGVSSGSTLLWPGQTIKVPFDDNNYLRDPETDRPLTVQQLSQRLRLSPHEFLKDNQRSFVNLSQHVMGEFFVNVRDVDLPNFGDITVQLGQLQPSEVRAKLAQSESSTKFFDRLKDAMDFGPRQGAEGEKFEDDSDLEEEAKIALMKERRNSGKDYWMGKKKKGGDDFDENDEESNRRKIALAGNSWETGWVSRVSVHEQKAEDLVKRIHDLEEAEKTSQARVRHLPLLASASGSRHGSESRPTSAMSRGGRVGDVDHSQQQQDLYNDENNYDDGEGDIDAAFGDSSASARNNNNNSKNKKVSRPQSATQINHLYKLGTSSPPPLADLDNIIHPSTSRPSSAASQLRHQVSQSRSSGGGGGVNANSAAAAAAGGSGGGYQQQQQMRLPGVPEEPAKPPRRPDLPEELYKFLRSDIIPTNKENTSEFFDFTRFRKILTDDSFRSVIEVITRKQPQSVKSAYFSGITNVAPETVLKGVALLCAYCPKFTEFTTDPMQFPPATMAQLKLLVAQKEELRTTKWVFESCLASQRSIIHLRSKKLTDASAILLDALDEMHAASHSLNIIDIRDNFLTGDTGRFHLRAILLRDWSSVTSVLVDNNPDLDEVAKKEIQTLAEKKERKQLEWMAYQQKREIQSNNNSIPRKKRSGANSPTTGGNRPNSSLSSFGAFGDNNNNNSTPEGGRMSPTQKRFLTRFDN